MKLIVCVLVLCLGQVLCRVYQTDESIIVEVDDEERHLVERSVDSYSDQWCRTREGKTGSCMSFRECYPFTNRPDFNELHGWVNATRSTCHFTDSTGRKTYGICCYKGLNETEIIDTKQFSICGLGPKQLTDPVFDGMNRIVGGTEAQRGSWPYIVSLMRNGRHSCGGTLISQTHVLTAAHCVARLTSTDVAAMSVVVQTHTIRPVDPWAIKAKVRRVTRHRSFNSRNLFNDIAILTLMSPVQFTGSVSPVCLPNFGETNQFANYDAAVIGWGAVREGGSVSPVLQQVKVRVQSNSQCASSYGSSAPSGIISSMVCAAYPGKDSCQGDSGGPLLIPLQGKWVQIGVVSWGIGCGKPPYPGVYTRVSSFSQWIQSNMQ